MSSQAVLCCLQGGLIYRPSMRGVGGGVGTSRTAFPHHCKEERWDGMMNPL